MKLEEIQALIKFVAKSGVSEVDLEMNDVKIVIKTPTKETRKKGTEIEQQVVQAGMPMMQPMMSPPIPSPAAATPAPATTASSGEKDSEVENSNYIEVKSPMIGTFYRSSSPDKPSFKNVGDKVSEGDVTCIIEAMKLFNEIESEISGTIVKVLVDDATPVEYDQPLFLVDPS